MLGAGDPLPHRPQRILIAGVTGSGKTTLARRLSRDLGIPHRELDALNWGPGWTTRPDFRENVEAFADDPAWIAEFQYTSRIGMLLGDRADTVVWLDLPFRVSFWRLLRRTVRRRVRRERVWGHSVEAPLVTVLTDRDHILRWWWRTRHNWRERMPRLAAAHPEWAVVRLRSSRDVERWVERLALGS